MASGKGTLNRVTLMGRLGANPQAKTTPQGKLHVSFNLATVNIWKESDGKQQDRTDWHRVVMWGRQAEIAKEYLKKGSYVYLEGRLQTRNYEDRGEKKFITEVVSENFQMLSKEGDVSTGGETQEEYQF